MDFKAMLDYCARLAANNDRTWFHENHKEYEEAREYFLGLLDLLRFAIADRAPALAPSIMLMQPKNWVYRVARDMRFYKNRPPYDPAFRAYICTDRKSWQPIGYYLRLDPAGSCFGTGLWCPGTGEAASTREFISDNAGRLKSLAEKSGITIGGEKLKRLPAGLDPESPAAEWLYHKSWDMIVYPSAEDLTDAQTLVDYVSAAVERIEPLRLYFLDAARAALPKKQTSGRYYDS